MNLQPYPISYHKRKKNAFEFLSKGKKKVLKVVELQETQSRGVYNLAMGDMIGGNISYSNITDNKDTAVVMQTVAHIVQVFTNAYPDQYVFVKGDTDVKTRLYQMYLSNNLEKVQENLRCGEETEMEQVLKTLKKVKIMVVSWSGDFKRLISQCMKGMRLQTITKTAKKTATAGTGSRPSAKRTVPATSAKRNARTAKPSNDRSSQQDVLMPKKLEIANKFLTGLAIPV